MTLDETGQSRPSSDRSRDGDRSPSVVIVADSDPAVTDEIATVLRERYTVRSAYDSADAFASLDADVGVALFDPDIPGLSVQAVRKRTRTETVDCQVAALTDEPIDIDATWFDDCLVKPVASDHLVSTVDRLSRRAEYRTTLETYYQTASEHANTTDSDRRSELDDRLARLDQHLDDIFRDLEGSDAYDTALRELELDS
jgi:DNA-binding response OmpR family regulator